MAFLFICVMKITLIQIGKIHFDFVNEGSDLFLNRLKHYTKMESLIIELPAKLKTTDVDQIKRNEADLLLKKINPNDFLVLLDERGKGLNSLAFASQIQQWQNHQSSIVFVIGGAYGFDQKVYDRCNYKLSLSLMTFSHQLFRVIFLEQLYRAFTILKGEPYHHE